jgi:hypothetical protein
MKTNQPFYADILAAARSAPVTSPTIAWRTCSFDNLGGVAYERPVSSKNSGSFAISAPVSIFTQDEAIIYGLVRYELANSPEAVARYLERKNADEIRARYAQARARRDEAQAQVNAAQERAVARMRAIAQMRASRGQR